MKTTFSKIFNATGIFVTGRYSTILLVFVVLGMGVVANNVQSRGRVVFLITRLKMCIREGEEEFVACFINVLGYSIGSNHPFWPHAFQRKHLQQNF